MKFPLIDVSALHRLLRGFLDKSALLCNECCSLRRIAWNFGLSSTESGSMNCIMCLSFLQRGYSSRIGEWLISDMHEASLLTYNHCPGPVEMKALHG